MQETTEKQKISTSFSDLKDLLKAYVVERIELGKLTVAEYLTHIVGTIVLCVFIAVLIGVGFVFLALALAHILALWLPMYVCYLIVMALYAITIPILFAYKHTLIYNPLARAITSKLLKPDDYE